MKIVLLGTTGYHPTETRHTACMMLPECGIILDAGTGMFRARDLLATTELDIFLTHTHLDHVMGLTYLFDVLFEKPAQRARVHGIGEKLAALKTHLFNQHLFPVLPPIDWRPLTEQPLTLAGGARLTHFPLNHPGNSVGYRLDWPDRSLAYVTDTTASSDADYVKKIQGVSLLLHECYFPDGHEDKAKLTGHSCLTPVLQVARAAQVQRLILVHINPLAVRDEEMGLAAALEVFPGAEFGRDHMEIEF
jgi:ribonuclease BN (tRNA processing enzyme)